MEDGLLTTIIAAVIFAVLMYFFRLVMNRLKGKAGEKVVARMLGKLPKEQYIVLDDVTIPTPRGSNQIDHLIISVFGIFVLETKNYTGWIYGSESGEYWTQNIYGKKNQLYNPILQNAGHLRALRRVLKDFEPLPYISIVAFSEKADLKVKVKDACVIYWGQIRDVIGSYDREKLSWEQVLSIRNCILENQMEPGRETNREHRRNVRKIKEQKK
jgi:hypothetical protein